MDEHLLPLVSHQMDFGIRQKIFLCLPFLAAARAPLKHHHENSKIIQAERGKGYAMGNAVDIQSGGLNYPAFAGFTAWTDSTNSA